MCTPHGAAQSLRVSTIMIAQNLHVLTAAMQIAQAVLKHPSPVRLAGLWGQKADQQGNVLHDVAVPAEFAAQVLIVCD